MVLSSTGEEACENSHDVRALLRALLSLAYLERLSCWYVALYVGVLCGQISFKGTKTFLLLKECRLLWPRRELHRGKIASLD